MPDINKDLLLDRILHSGDFTALEKRYLENLILLAGMPYVTMRADKIPEDLKEFLKNAKITPDDVASFDPGMLQEFLSLVDGGDKDVGQNTSEC